MSRTIPSLPFGGWTLASFDPSDNTVSDAGDALLVPPGARATSPIWPAAATFWCHYTVAAGLPFDPATNDFHLDFYAGATKVLEVLISGETSMTFDFRTLQHGLGLTHVGSVTLPTFGAGAQRFDVGIAAGMAGSLMVAVADGMQIAATGLDHRDWAGVTQVVHRAFGDGFGVAAAATWREVLWDSQPTIGSRLIRVLQDTNSAVNTGIPGGVGNVNELPTNDATAIVSTAAAQCSTYYQAALDLTGDNVVGYIGAARLMTEGAGPTHAEITQRGAGANYSSPPILAGASFEAAGYGWRVNPATGLAYTAAAAAAAELGATSAA